LELLEKKKLLSFSISPLDHICLKQRGSEKKNSQGDDVKENE